jgi:ATP-grasp domain, R2K clade family 2
LRCAASRYATTAGSTCPLPADPHRTAVLDIAAALLDACADSLPSAVVVRVGLASNADRGDEHWAVVEANMAWFST